MMFKLFGMEFDPFGKINPACALFRLLVRLYAPAPGMDTFDRYGDKEAWGIMLGCEPTTEAIEERLRNPDGGDNE
jgi:hypothetical protein